jgi:two-component system response regulator NreC
MALKVLLADDHHVVRQGIRAVLEREGFQVIAEAANGREAVALAKAHNPDIAVLDLSMPELNGIGAAEEILQASSRTGVLLLTMHTGEHQVLTALRAGIRGYVVKTQALEELVRAIRDVATGGTYLSPAVSGIVVDAYLSHTDTASDPLTPREREVLQLVAEGRTSKEVASRLGVATKTAESYRARIMDKLDIHDTAGLVRYAIRRGLIQASGMFSIVGQMMDACM